nr:recombinase family protein [uncultured Clostridium sp.]
MKASDKNVWIYCRVANNENNILEVQRGKLILFANKHGFNVVGNSQDIGSGLDYSRKGLSETKQAISEKKAGVVLVQDLSRIGRHKFKNITYSTFPANISE